RPAQGHAVGDNLALEVTGICGGGSPVGGFHDAIERLNRPLAIKFRPFTNGLSWEVRGQSANLAVMAVFFQKQFHLGDGDVAIEATSTSALRVRPRRL
ncbi:MAG TPA: hypothetical protein VIH43_06240, partial [Chthoniobacterales bacterium]